MKTLYLECRMGAAGDMLMAALYELLDDQAGFLRTMNGLGLPGVAVEAQAASTCGIAGTHMAVTVCGEEEESHDEGHSHHAHTHEGPGHSHDHGHGGHHHAALTDIRGHIAALPLPQAVRDRAVSVYDRLAAAEARAHGCPVDQVHFHEVGALDAVADVAGVCYALSLLKPERIVVSQLVRSPGVL